MILFVALVVVVEQHVRIGDHWRCPQRHRRALHHQILVLFVWSKMDRHAQEKLRIPSNPQRNGFAAYIIAIYLVTNDRVLIFKKD